MKIHRFVIESSGAQKAAPFDVTLEAENHHHLSRSLRLKDGDTVELIDKTTSHVFTGTITSITKEATLVRVTKALPRPFVPGLHLFVGQTARSTFDDVVAQAVEVGASTITFFEAENSPYALDEDKLSKKKERLERIIEAAIKQSGLNGTWPKLFFVKNIKEALRGIPTENQNNKLIFVSPDQGEGQKTPLITGLFNARQGKSTELQKKRLSVDFYTIIGPEGGFSKEEIRLCLENGFCAVSLGPKVLRVETAIVVALSATMLLAVERNEVSEMQSCSLSQKA